MTRREPGNILGVYLTAPTVIFAYEKKLSKDAAADAPSFFDEVFSEMTGFSESEKLIFAGQLLLALCCGIYIPWWFKVFKPGQPHDWVAGGAGIMLLLTFLSGLAGFVLTTMGNSRAQAERDLFYGFHPLAAWVILYIAMMALTVLAFQRPVTTELFLITGWLMLEAVTVNALYGTGRFGRGMAVGAIVVMAAVFVADMALYVRYYRLDQWLAYKLAAVPLALDGAAMLAIAGMMFLRR